MADMLTANFLDFMREMRGPVVENFPKNHLLHARLKRNTDKRNLSGEQVRVPIILVDLQGAQGVAEDGVINDPHRIESTQAHIDMFRAIIPVSISPDLIYRSRDTRDTSWKEAVGLLVELATTSMAKLENEMCWGQGNALIANVTGTSTGTTVTVGTTVNWRHLRRRRVVDFRVRSTGALKANGSRRKITDFDRAAGTITIDQAVSVDSNDGIYMEGSYGNAIKGIQLADDTSGTFEDISRSSFPEWKFIDGRDGSVTDVDPTLSVLDEGRRLVEGESGELPTLWTGDEGVVDKYEQLLQVQTHYAGERREINGGFEVVMYRGKPMAADYDAPRNSLYGLNESSMTMYAYPGFDGPDWDELDGTRMKRIGTRSLPVEMWLVDFVQLGWHRLNTGVRYFNLNAAR